MRLRAIRWKPDAKSQDRIDCMAYLLSVEDPPMPSEFFINDIWVMEIEVPVKRLEVSE